MVQYTVLPRFPGRPPISTVSAVCLEGDVEMESKKPKLDSEASAAV